MKNFLMGFLIVACLWVPALAWNLHIAHAQGEPKSEPIMASPEMQTKILRLQLQSQKIVTEYQACQARNWNADATKLQAEMQQEVDAAFKEAKLDKKDYELNMDTFEFVKKAPKPEEKK